jgi:zinc transporter
MAQAPLAYGTSPGLRFACLLDGRGGCVNLDWAGVAAWQREDGVLWVHLERDAPEAADWLRHRSGVDALIAEALLSEDTRPRVDAGDDSLLLILRGVDHQPGTEHVDLVPAHLWVTPHRVISLRDSGHYLMALRALREALVNGRGPRTPGELVVGIAEKVVRDVEPLLDELDAAADRLDEACEAEAPQDWRHELGALRRRAIELRRYLAPQREALHRLQLEEMSWLNRRDRLSLREITDRTIRFVDSLDAVRDRATLLHEDLAAQLSERIGKIATRLTAVSAILLPPSLIAGMFGMNVGGVPGGGVEWGFWAVVAALCALMAAEVWLLRRLGWF